MRKRVLDDSGLPAPGSRNPIGQFCGRLSKEAWEKIGHMKVLWEKERGFPLSITEVVEACVHQNYKRVVDESVFLVANHPTKEEEPAAEPPLTEVRVLGEPQTAKRKKKSYVRKP